MLFRQSFLNHRGAAALGSLLLWVLIAVLGVLSILAVREVVLGLYVLSLESIPSYSEFALLSPRGYNRSYWVGVTLTQWATFLSTILWIGVVIGGAEFLAHNYGKPKAWRFLGWIIGIELVVLILGYVL